MHMVFVILFIAYPMPTCLIKINWSNMANSHLIMPEFPLHRFSTLVSDSSTSSLEVLSSIILSNVAAVQYVARKYGCNCVSRDGNLKIHIENKRKLCA